MSTIADTLQTAQTRAFDLLADSQETAVKALDSWTDFMATQAKAFIPESVDTEVFAPLVDALPRPSVVVTQAYDLASEVLASQRRMAERLAASVEDLYPAAK